MYSILPKIQEIGQWYVVLLNENIEPIPMLKIVQYFLYLVSSICDNWYYLGRVGVYKWKNSQQDYFVSILCTATATCCLTIDIINELLVMHAKSKTDDKFSLSKYRDDKLLWYI